jgi:Na+(H+)/acetate symporter ActP
MPASRRTIAAPLALMIASGEPIPLPGHENAFDQSLASLSPMASAPAETDGLLIAAMALGLGALPPLLAPLLTTTRSGEARSGGLAGLLWCGLLALMALVIVAASTLALQAGVTGLRLNDLPQFLLAASGRGHVSICGANPLTIAQAREACAAVTGFADALRPTDIAATTDYLLLGLPDLRGYGAAFSALAMAGRMSVALALCAAGFLTLATALGDSAFYRANKAYRLASGRLAARRLLMLAALGGGVWILCDMVPDPRILIALAIGLSAVAIAPLLALCLWPRAEGQDGAICLVAGMATAEAMILLSGEAPTIEVLATAAVVGCATAIAAGIGASFLHPADTTSEGAAFVHGLLHGQGDVLRPDKGA